MTKEEIQIFNAGYDAGYRDALKSCVDEDDGGQYINGDRADEVIANRRENYPYYDTFKALQEFQP